MKYIINENKLEQMVFKFLDSKFENLERVKGKYYDIIFRFPGEKYGVLGWEKSGNLEIYDEFIDNISSFFPIEKTDIEKIIGRYVEDRYNLRVINTFFEYNLISRMVEDRYNLRVINTCTSYYVSPLVVEDR